MTLRATFARPMMLLGIAIQLVASTASSVAAAAPPLYDGELNVCNSLARATAGGMSVPAATGAVLRGFDADDPATLNSIQRTVIQHAIALCRQPPAEVLTGAYQAGVGLDVILAAAFGAGISEARAFDLLQAAGAAPGALARAAQIIQTPEAFAAAGLPPPVIIIGGLGQAPSSPFGF